VVAFTVTCLCLTELESAVAASGDAVRCTNRCSAHGPLPLRGVGNDLPGFVRNEEVLAGEDRLGEPTGVQRQSAEDATCRGVEQVHGG